jgi:hypothetical protein
MTNFKRQINIKRFRILNFGNCTLFVFCFLFFVAPSCFSQKNVTTAGFQYKPIFPSAFFSTGTNTVEESGIDFSVSQKYGFCAGMIIRRGFTNRISVETGINYTKRNFNLAITDTTFTGKSDFTIIGYEIPLQALIFLQLTEKVFINASGGVSMDMYPSNIRTKDTYFVHDAQRSSVFQFGALANLGGEYRTEKIGYFYLGASYHLPFSHFYTSRMEYLPGQRTAFMKLGGNYLTVDVRYYFHEDPTKPKKKKKKKEK